MRSKPDLTDRESAILDQVKVNAPATMLLDGMLDRILSWSIHPEVGLDVKAMEQIPRSVLSDMAARIKNAGLRPTVHGPFMDLAPGAMDPLILEVTRSRLRQAIELASIFKPEYLVFHANYDWTRYGGSPQRWLDVSIQTWRPIMDRAKDLNLNIVMENVYEKNPSELIPLLSALTSEGLGFCFDIGHAHAFGRAPDLEWLEQTAPYLTTLHLHDNHGLKDDHVAIGRGVIDFPALFGWLAKTGRRPRITLEPHYEEHLWPSLSALSTLWPWPLDS
ncbi:MAG: sugar phosphate isomerase/epimerase [Deltaproteobacteria bacterium]|nr:sugar phosphate isomerase/epimerase [Deltaproteobacteria bacterium]